VPEAVNEVVLLLAKDAVVPLWRALVERPPELLELVGVY
jgi:hypothetical protein